MATPRIIPALGRYTCAQNQARRAWASAYHRRLPEGQRLAELQHYPGLRPGYKGMCARALQSQDSERIRRALVEMLKEIDRLEDARAQVRKALPLLHTYRQAA